MPTSTGRKKKHFGIDINRYLGIDVPQDRIHSPHHHRRPSRQRSSFAFRDSLSMMSGMSNFHFTPRTTGRRRGFNHSFSTQTSIPLMDRSNTQRTQNSNVTAATGTSFLPEVTSTPPLPTLQKPAMGTPPTGLRRVQQSDLSDPAATPTATRTPMQSSYGNMTATSVSRGIRMVPLNDVDSFPATPTRGGHIPRLPMHAIELPANATPRETFTYTPMTAPLDPDITAPLPNASRMPMNATRLPVDAGRQPSFPALPAGANHSPGVPMNVNRAPGRADRPPVQDRVGLVQASPSAKSTVKREFRMGQTPPLPAVWTPRHDRYMVTLDYNNLDHASIIRGLRRNFSELRQPGVVLVPDMIEKRVRQLEQDVTCDHFKHAIEWTEKRKAHVAEQKRMQQNHEQRLQASASNISLGNFTEAQEEQRPPLPLQRRP